MNTTRTQAAPWAGNAIPFYLILLALVVGAPLPAFAAPADTVAVRLTEWKVRLAPASVGAGPIVFEVSNGGTIPHAFEVEGHGVEKSTPEIKPGAKARLVLDLRAGEYEAYCPVGKGSHEMLGMKSKLTVGGAAAKRAAPATATHANAMAMAMSHEESRDATAGAKYPDGKDDDDDDDAPVKTRSMRIVGGGPVIQILPGPYPFADSAMAVIESRPADQKADLLHKAQMGPYSNNIAKIAGDFALEAIDRGGAKDSVSGIASFTTRDGARWRMVMDRVQTKDIPFNPRFGGVIMGLFYHGASGVHTPLVPTIQSSVALWALAHLYRDDHLVTDDAMVHVMLLSRTRRTSDWALDCWDCSNQPVEELQLQVTPGPNTPPFEVPGGVLFVNWEKSTVVP